MSKFNPSSREDPNEEKQWRKRKERSLSEILGEIEQETLKTLSYERDFYKKNQTTIAFVFLILGLIIGILIGVFLL